MELPDGALQSPAVIRMHEVEQTMADEARARVAEILRSRRCVRDHPVGVGQEQWDRRTLEDRVKRNLPARKLRGGERVRRDCAGRARSVAQLAACEGDNASEVGTCVLGHAGQYRQLPTLVADHDVAGAPIRVADREDQGSVWSDRRRHALERSGRHRDRVVLDRRGGRSLAGSPTMGVDVSARTSLLGIGRAAALCPSRAPD